MAAVTELASEVGASAACQALCLPRASYYRDRRKTSFLEETVSRPLPARALRPAEQESVLACLHQQRFPGSLRLHSGQSCFLPGIFSLVQRRTPPLKSRLTHAGDGPLQPDAPSSRTTPTSTRCRLSTSSGTLRAKRSKTSRRPHRGVDQQTSPTNMKKLTKFREHVSQGR